MKLTELDSQVSVSDQLDISDLTELFRDGVEIVVCNRPDREAADQTGFDEISNACETLGMEAHHIPFSGDAIEDHHVQSFLELLQSGRKIHAYCRSGARSSKLWAQARTRQGMDAGEIIQRAGRAGVDVSNHIRSPRSQV